MQKTGADPHGAVVAEVIYSAVTDDSWKLRYDVNTKGLLSARKFLPDSLFFKLIKSALIK